MAWDSTKAAGDLVTSSDYNVKTTVIKKNPTTVSQPKTRIDDGDYVVLSREVLGAGESIKVHASGVKPASVSGLNVVVRNVTDAVDIYSDNSETSYGPDLTSGGTADIVEVRVDNRSGAAQDVKGFCKYEVSSS